MTLPSVWFERPPLDEFTIEIAGACSVLGPTIDDPDAGLDMALAVIAGPRTYDASVMARAPLLRVIARTGIGYDGVDVEAATDRGIAVCNTPDGPTISTAEHAVGLIIAVAKRIPQSQAALRDGTDAYFARHLGIELEGKTLGLVGFGRIARHVGRIAEGIGMRIAFVDPFVDPATVPAGVTRVTSLATLLGSADVVSVHVPLSPATRGMFGTAEFGARRPGAVFVNTARGGLVDNDALLAALETGHLFGAGLDVTAPEPLPVGHPLLRRDDVLVTPHIASATREGKARMFRSAFAQAIDVIEGRRPDHLVNPEVWELISTTLQAGVGR